MDATFLVTSGSFPRTILAILLLRGNLSLARVVFIRATFAVTIFLFRFPDNIVSSLCDQGVICLASVLT